MLHGSGIVVAQNLKVAYDSSTGDLKVVVKNKNNLSIFWYRNITKLDDKLLFGYRKGVPYGTICYHIVR